MYAYTHVHSFPSNIYNIYLIYIFFFSILDLSHLLLSLLYILIIRLYIISRTRYLYYLQTPLSEIYPKMYKKKRNKKMR